jgi:RNA polymerase sigma-70 factor (ECF subfamily)
MNPDSKHQLGTLVPFPKAEVALSARTDDDLMRLCAAGMDDAFALLVRRHQGAVRGFCARMCGGSATGDDVAQEVFVELWRSRTRFEPRGRFRSYLFLIARTRCLNAVRRRRDEEDLSADLVQPGTELEAILERDRARRVQQKLALLPARLREALLLRYSAGLDYDEMARVLDRSQSTVRSRVFHGILRLRQLFGKEASR